MKKIKILIHTILNQIKYSQWFFRLTKRNAGIIVGGFMFVFLSVYLFRDKIPFFSATGNDPIAYWEFNEGTGSTVYDTVGSNDGSLGSGSSAPTWVTDDQCITEKCLRFDGTDDYIFVADTNNLDFGTSTAFTISAWIYIPTGSDGRNIVTKGDDSGGDGTWGFDHHASNNLNFFISGDDTTYCTVRSNSPLTKDRWHYVAVAVNRNASCTTNDVILYSDGLSLERNIIFSSGNANADLNNDDVLFVGDKNGSTNFKGKMDEVKIYDYARSADQIKADYAARGTVRGVAASFGYPDTGKKLSDGLVGYWKMDEVGVSGSDWTAIDSSGNNNNGTGGGNASVGTTQPGKFGNGGFFDGTGDQVVVPDSTSMDVGPNATWSVWLKLSSLPSVTGNTYRILDKYIGTGNQRSYTLSITTTDKLHMIIDPAGTGSSEIDVASDNALNTGVWYHVAVVADGTNAYMYVNNVKQADVESINAVYASTASLYIGSDTNSLFFIGSIDEVRVYNRAFSKDEISQLYNFVPGPVGYWKMDEGQGSTTIDSSGNGNTAAFGSGNSAPVWTNGKYGQGLVFDGNNDRMVVTDGGTSALDLPQSFTIGTWINMRSFPGVSNYDTIISKGTDTLDTNYFFELTGTDEMDCGFSNGSYQTHETTSANLSTNNWYYISCVFDNGNNTVKMYVNGIQVYSASETNTPVTGNASVYIGAEAQTTQPIDGKIDDVKIYNYARTQAQILEDMNAGHPAVGTPVGSTVLHLKMDEGYGTTTQDWSPQNNDGNLASGTAAPSWTTNGKLGKAFQFDGTADYISVPHSSSIDFGSSSSFSMAVWLNPASNPIAGQGRTIIEKRNGASGAMIRIGHLHTSNLVQFNIYDGTNNPSINTSKVFPLGSWTHYVAVVNQDTGRIQTYINGNIDADTADAGLGSVTNAGPWLIGKGNDQDRFAGSIDEFKIYPFALTADQVKTDYSFGKSQVMGALSTGLGGTSPSFADSREYCVPGDTTTCGAPVVELLLNEGVGNTANDTSGNGNEGSIRNGANWIAGKKGNAVTFDGSNDYIAVLDSNTLDFGTSTNFSVSVWAKFADTGDVTLLHDGEEVAGADASWHMDFDTDTNKMFWIITSDTYNFYCIGTGTTNPADNSWHHFTGVVTRSAAACNNSDMKLYIDGKPETLSISGVMASNVNLDNNDPLTIGAYDDTNSPNNFKNEFNGIIDQVRIYNYARTAAQIAWEYNRGAPVAYYKFEECTGTSIKDWGPNGNGGYNGNTATLTVGASGTQTAAGTCSSGNSAHAWNNGTTGKKGASLNFDSTDDYVGIGSTMPYAQGSITAWIKLASTSGTYTILGSGDVAGTTRYFHFRVGGTALAIAQRDNDTEDYLTASQVLTAGTWYHVALTSNDSEYKMYINGALQNLTLQGGSNTGDWLDSVTGADNLTVGLLQRTSDQYLFNGQIDEVKIFNYPLTPAQVKTEMTGGAVRFQ